MSITTRQFISIYTIRARKKNSNHLTFEELIEDKKKLGYKDLFLTIQEFLEELESTSFEDKEKESVTGIENLTIEPRNRRISGMLRSGVFGVEGVLYDTASSKGRKLEKHEAPLYGYYFTFYIPKDGHSGVFALHSRGRHGCKTQLDLALKKYIFDKDLPITVEIFSTKLDFEKDHQAFYKHFSIKRLETVEYRSLKREDALMAGKGIQPKVVVKKSVEVKGGLSSLFNFKKFARKGRQKMLSKVKFRQYVGFKVPEDASFSITVEMDGQEKTMDINKEMRFNMSFDITKEFDDYNRKDPSFAKLKEVAESYIAHAIRKIAS